jgi:hypothetical protein
MPRPPGSLKPFLEDPDLCSIAAVNFLKSIGLSDIDALSFVAAKSFGKEVKPDSSAIKKHRERLKEGWNLDSFELPCTVAGKVSTLRKKAARNIDDESINPLRMGAAAHAIASAAHVNLNLRREMLSMLSKMGADNAMLQNYILSLLASITDDRRPQTVSDKPAAVAAAEAKRAAKNATRMRQARAANGATPRTESISKKKPWEKLGISRRTWYLKRKPA